MVAHQPFFKTHSETSLVSDHPGASRHPLLCKEGNTDFCALSLCLMLNLRFIVSVFDKRCVEFAQETTQPGRFSPYFQWFGLSACWHSDCYYDGLS